jgi:ribosomal protein S17
MTELNSRTLQGKVISNKMDKAVGLPRPSTIQVAAQPPVPQVRVEKFKQAHKHKAIKEGINKAEAEEIKKKIEEAGGVVELK